MKITLKKEETLTLEIPEDKVKDYFEYMGEQGFIYWADINMSLEMPTEMQDDNSVLDGWLDELTTSIDIENPPKWLKKHYSKKDIDRINDERERMERCDECTALGDDCYTDSNGEWVNGCETCPFNSSNDDD